MPISSQMSILGEIWWKKCKFPVVNYNFFPSGVLAAFGHKMCAKIKHESAKSVSILLKFFCVMASEGTYQNAESIKCVTVTGPY
jgi:hypothetical protein